MSMLASKFINHDSGPEPGQIRLINLKDYALYGSESTKWRPGIILSGAGLRGVRVMGLTTLPLHKDGTSRVQIPESSRVVLGASTGSYLWSKNTTYVPLHDVLRLVGWVDGPTAEAVIELCGDRLVGTEAAALREAARIHHG